MPYVDVMLSDGAWLRDGHELAGSHDTSIV